MLIKCVDKYEFFKNGPNFIHYDVEKKKYPTTDIDKLIGKMMQDELSPRGKAAKKKKVLGAGRQNLRMTFAKMALRNKMLANSDANHLQKQIKAKQDMEIKITERMQALGIKYFELDSVIPPTNDVNLDLVDYRMILYRLLIR